MQVESKYHITKEEQQKELICIDAAKISPSAFEPLYNHYHEQIFRFIYQRVSNMDVAADICSDVFVKALINLKKYEYRGLPFSSWLYRIASNEIAQMARENNHTRTINPEEMQISEILREVEEKDYEKYYNKMLDSISELPEEELQLIEMRFFENRPFREIGEILNMTENNAKVKLYRLLEKLKKIITEKN